MRARFLAALSLGLLFAAPLAAAEPENCALKTIAKLPMTTLPSGRVTVPLTVMQRPSNFLLDTAGAISQLNTYVIAELNLRVQAGGAQLTGVDGRRREGYVMVPSITLGGVEIPKQFFFAARPIYKAPDGQPTGGNTFDGLLAPSMLRNVDYDLNFTGKMLTLFSDEHCAGKDIYWPAEVVAIVPFKVNRPDHITFDVELDGQQVEATLDTGASDATLDQDLARTKFGVDLAGDSVRKSGELEGCPIYEKRFSTLTFEGITVKNPVMRLLPNLIDQGEVTGTRIKRDRSDTLPRIIVGMSALKKLHVYIATEERKLYITPGAAQKAVPAEAPR